MSKTRSIAILKLATGILAGLSLTACSVAGLPSFAPMKPKSKHAQVAQVRPAPKPERPGDGLRADGLAAPAPSRSSNLDGLIASYSSRYGVPESLVAPRHSARERLQSQRPQRSLSRVDADQIRHDTARSMGYTGSANGLLDAETNLKYAVKYLAGAYRVGGRDPDQAVRNYSRGYYYDAKRQGLLEEVGLR